MAKKEDNIQHTALPPVNDLVDQPTLKMFTYHRNVRGGGKKFISSIAAHSREEADKFLANAMASDLLRKFTVNETPLG